MSDLISRKALIEEIKQRAGMWQKTAEKFIAVIEEQPTVEEIPVQVLTDAILEKTKIVHCKDCTHWGTGLVAETERVKCCEFAKWMIGENGYCVYGERKEDEKTR